ncbi:hypothetical protein [Pseudozobellia sp. WGM2]|uniref:hypothetical protein n=1 Tax=Pseudozobellia sp. WGM2 TaxID=2787625 RepID=UPI001ADF0EB7|nr:hypothetical protein [Pseudozobellia sp. WGM2]
MFGDDLKIRIIELVGEYLNKYPVEEQINNLAGQLDYKELCYFTRNFSDYSHKNELEKLIIEKVKSRHEELPFFVPYAPENKMVMSVWSDYDREEFEQYISNSISKKEVLGALLQYFPIHYINKGFGSIDRENYNYMKSLLNLDLLYEKTEIYYPDLITKVKKMNTFSDNGINKIEECIEQFIYIYIREKDQNTNPKL